MLACVGCQAAPALSSDKSVYSLANPTPATLLRELTTDRPDFTESPFTVDAGHVQFEADFANLTQNHVDAVRTRELSVGAFNIRLGLLPQVEAGVFVSPYIHHRETSSNAPHLSYSGFGDITLRGKLNFWGNDGGPTALGLIADVKLPTASGSVGNGAVEGNIIVPINLELGAGWELAAMTEVDVIKNDNRSGRELAWANSLSLGHAITAKVGGYVELTSSVGPGAPLATVDLGLTWSLDANTQLDAGVNLGLTRAADEAVFFTGMSRRF